MTKEEYKEQHCDSLVQWVQRMNNGTISNKIIVLLEAAYKTGFDAGCEYYKKQVLEL